MTDSTTNLASMIAAWHKETFRLLIAKISCDLKSWTEIDKLCVCMTRTSADYCAAIMRLLDDAHEWPAKALMRCLGELNVKFTWCLVGCEEQDNSREAITERIQRWFKTTCSKGIKLLDEFDSVVQANDRNQHDQVRNELEEHQKSLAVKEMPNLEQIFKQLGSRYYNEIKPVFYTKFNSAVHIDPSAMLAVYVNLAEGHNELTRHCAAYASNINSLIRSQYEFAMDDIQRAFKQV